MGSLEESRREYLSEYVEGRVGLHDLDHGLQLHSRDPVPKRTRRMELNEGLSSILSKLSVYYQTIDKPLNPHTHDRCMHVHHDHVY